MKALLHNPKCSKSRKAKELLDESGQEYQVRLYLEDPLTESELTDLVNMLGKNSELLIRKKESEFQDLGISELTEKAIVSSILKFPKIMERPVVIDGKRALIARPPEQLVEWLK